MERTLDKHENFCIIRTMKQITSNTIVADRDVLERFLNVMPELERDEVYFLSLSARNKYLTEEEREEFDLGRTEMFSRQIAYDREGILMAIARMEADLSVRRTRNGKEIPHKCLVVYINIHPSSTIKAYTDFTKQMNHHFSETFMAVANGKNANYEPFQRCRTHLMNHIQRSSSRKNFIDIDIDCKNENNLEKARSHVHCGLINSHISHHIVKTQGGYHVLVDKVKMKEEHNNFPLYKLVEKANETVGDDGEAVFNKNAMVPLPGTYQAGKTVTLKSFKWS